MYYNSNHVPKLYPARHISIKRGGAVRSYGVDTRDLCIATGVISAGEKMCLGEGRNGEMYLRTVNAARLYFSL